MLIKSYAKINLILEILKKLPSGYHEIQSVMQQINLYDVLTFKKIKQNKIILKSSIKKIQNKNNLAYKSAFLLKNEYKIKEGVEINIDKKIPLAAGLGGGSSNAASTLMTLNKLFNLKLKKNELIELASKIGSDVPFFIEGKTAFIKGIGEKIKKIENKAKLNLLIINPGFEITTKWAYEEFDKSIINKETDINKKNSKENKTKKLIEALKNNDIKRISESLYNDFEPIMIKKFPIIKKIKNDLVSNKALNALMSGSGSSVFGIFENNEDAKNAFKELNKKYSYAALTHSIV